MGNGSQDMNDYRSLLRLVLDMGEKREDRTGVGTLSIFGAQMRFSLNDGFPLLTERKLSVKVVIHELLWMIRGETSVRPLQEAGVTIWDEWARADGDLGPIYGRQWRAWVGADGRVHDQLLQVERELRANPTSRRMLISAWNVGDLERMALPPCHVLFQLYVHGDGRLSGHLYQRSGDLFLGVPYNIAEYALLIHLFAATVGLRPGELIHSVGDAHLYLNHLDQARELLARWPRKLPTLRVTPRPSIIDYRPEDIEIVGYVPHPMIRAPVAV